MATSFSVRRRHPVKGSDTGSSQPSLATSFSVKRRRGKGSGTGPPQPRMATSFDEVLRKQQSLAEELHKYSGVDIFLIKKIIQYAQMLPAPEKPGIISEMVFKAQMGHRFGVTSPFHLQCMYEAVRRRCVNKTAIQVFDYAKLICMFYSKNFDDKVNFVFSAYDLDKDGFLSFTELMQLLKTSVTAFDEEDQYGDDLKELLDIVLSIISRNRQEHLSLHDYRSFAKKNTYFIQILGQVLPREDELEKFMAMLRKMSDIHLKEYFQRERRRCLNMPLLRGSSAEEYERLYPVRLDLFDLL